MSQIKFTKVKHDTNGNPRYVCHFLNLLNDADEDKIKEDYAASLSINPLKLTSFKYEVALDRAKKIGGKKFHNKQYGGGIVFQCFNLNQLEKDILELKAANQ